MKYYKWWKSHGELSSSGEESSKEELEEHKRVIRSGLVNIRESIQRNWKREAQRLRQAQRVTRWSSDTSGKTEYNKQNYQNEFALSQIETTRG